MEITRGDEVMISRFLSTAVLKFIGDRFKKLGKSGQRKTDFPRQNGRKLQTHFSWKEQQCVCILNLL